MILQPNKATLQATIAPSEALRGMMVPGERLQATLSQGPMMSGGGSGAGGCKPEQQKRLQITDNGEYEIRPDEGYTLSGVDIDVEVPIPAAPAPVIQPIKITENGTYSAPEGVDGYSPVTVDAKTEAAEHTRVGYIQFTGNQIVDTGIICNQDTEIRIVFTRDSDAAQYMYGVVNSGNTASVTAYLSSGGSWRFGNKSVARAINTNPELVHCAIVSKSGIIHAGGTNAFSGLSSFETIGTLLIGACRSADGEVGSAQFVGKILELDILQSTTPVLQLVPDNKPDGEYAFWDMISERYLASITDIPLKGGPI